jgi:hypothetical protein
MATLIAAIAGVSGTLFSPLIQARLSHRAAEQRAADEDRVRFSDNKSRVFVEYLNARVQYHRTCEKLYLQGRLTERRQQDLERLVRDDGARVHALETEIHLLAPTVGELIDNLNRDGGQFPRTGHGALATTVIEAWARRYAQATDLFYAPMRQSLGIIEAAPRTADA